MGSAADRLALLLVVVLGAIAIAVGVRAGYTQVDADELVYRRTLVAMQHGQGYYPATRAALVRKEGRPPSQLRSVRPPTLFLLLRWLPASTWRWVVGLVYVATLALVWRLSRPLAPWGAPVAVSLAALWLFGASPLLFLHSELWGVPFLLGGALALRGERFWAAAALLGAAVLFRETYAVAFAAGLVWSGRRRPFWVAAGLLAGLFAVHAWLAQSALSPHGHENALRNGTLGLRFVLNAMSPLNQPIGWLVGVASLVLGGAGIVQRWTLDSAARVVGATAVVLLPATIVVGRDYWSLTYGIALVCFVPAGVAAVLRDRAYPLRA